VNSEHPKKDLALIGNKFEETCQKLVKNHRPKNSPQKRKKCQNMEKNNSKNYFFP